MKGKTIKKLSLLAGAGVVVSMLWMGPSIAQEDGSAYLQQIAQNTLETLGRVNNFPGYIQTMVTYALNMQKFDDSQDMRDMQGHFATTGNAIVQNAMAQLTAQTSLNRDMLGPDANPQTMPFANDVTYSTLLGQPYFNPDPRNIPLLPPMANPPYNYIKNAAGIAVPHTLPRSNWRGGENLIRYMSYYNTTMAVESFNGYVLSNLLAELQNGNALSTAQQALVTQASGSNWIANIATEEIGKVLRQLLVFQSQTYVLMTQMLQTQKQMLTAQVMTNALIIAGNQPNEVSMIEKAQGLSPGT